MKKKMFAKKVESAAAPKLYNGNKNATLFLDRDKFV